MDIRCNNLDRDFVVVWLKNYEIQIEQLNLVKKKSFYEITNGDIIEVLSLSFTDYKCSRKTLEEYFNRTILFCYSIEKKFKFNLEPQFDIKNPLLIFGKKNHKGELSSYRFYFDTPLEQLRCEVPLLMELNDILRIYGFKDNITMDDITAFEDQYQVIINIYSIFSYCNGNMTQICAAQNSIKASIREPNWEPILTINIAVDENDCIYWLPSTNLIKPIYKCDKYPGECFYSSIDKRNFERHMKVCRNEPKITSKQECLGKNETMLDTIIKEGYLPKTLTNYYNPKFMTWDIETLEMKTPEPDMNCDNTTIEAILKPVSIAVGSNFVPPKVFIRKSSSPEHGQELINEFMEYLLDSYKVFHDTVHSAIKTAIQVLLAMIVGEQKKPLKNNFLITKWFSRMNYLKRYMRMNVYGFNSQKFDMPCIIGGLSHYCLKNNLEIDVLKRSTSYMNVTIGNIAFRDILNYTAPCSLDKYLKQWNAPVGKSIFPHG